MNFLWYILVGILLSGPALAESCTKQSATEAEETIALHENWDALYGWFQKYKQCSDGASISEGTNDVVEKLLSKDWGHFGRFVELSTDDARFRSFVLDNINDVTTMEGAKAISINAQQRCPADARDLCAAIITRASQR